MTRLSIIPLACYAVLVAYACFAAAIVGHWPYYSEPDPKNLPLQPLYSIVAYTSLAGVLSIFIVPAIYAGHCLVAKWRRVDLNAKMRRPVTIYCLGAVAWLADLGLTAAGRQTLISWLID